MYHRYDLFIVSKWMFSVRTWCNLQDFSLGTTATLTCENLSLGPFLVYFCITQCLYLSLASNYAWTFCVSCDFFCQRVCYFGLSVFVCGDSLAVLGERFRTHILCTLESWKNVSNLLDKCWPIKGHKKEQKEKCGLQIECFVYNSQ